jgi:hypothetical protein
MDVAEARPGRVPCFESWATSTIKRARGHPGRLHSSSAARFAPIEMLLGCSLKARLRKAATHGRNARLHPPGTPLPPGLGG